MWCICILLCLIRMVRCLYWVSLSCDVLGVGLKCMICVLIVFILVGWVVVVYWLN